MCFTRSLHLVEKNSNFSISLKSISNVEQRSAMKESTIFMTRQFWIVYSTVWQDFCVRAKTTERVHLYFSHPYVWFFKKFEVKKFHNNWKIFQVNALIKISFATFNCGDRELRKIFFFHFWMPCKRRAGAKYRQNYCYRVVWYFLLKGDNLLFDYLKAVAAKLHLCNRRLSSGWSSKNY